jgi:endo-1,4-beta-xylanase
MLLGASLARGGIHDLAYPSALLKQNVPIKVYTPPGYEAATAVRYPVVYNLHGGGGSPERQWDRTRATLTDAMEHRRVRPMIYVFVNGLGNTEFVNTAAGQPIERSIIEELIPFIDARYPTIASRAGRAVDGFSMGGFGCLSVAMRHPILFCAAVGYGAALSITAAGKNYRDPAHFAEHDPHALIRAKADLIREKIRLRLVVGDADWLYPANVKFKALLDELRVPADWVVVPGVAHNTMGLYEARDLASLHWLEDSFEQAAAARPMHATVGRPPRAPTTA